MIVKKISFPIPLTDVEDIYDDNVDVFVDLQNGLNYTVVVGTYKNIISLMDNPMIIVKKLTMEVIQEAIQAYGIG